MIFFPKRNERTKRKKYKSSKFTLLLIANLWLMYFIFISMNYFSTNNTYSYFSEEDKIENTFSASENFCADKDYKKNHKDVCKDNAGIGNGSEPVDQNDYTTGDEDNPGHQNQYCPDDPNTPEIEVCNDQNNGKGNTNNNSNTPVSSDGSATGP
jgi:hypothetical protein